MRLLIAFVILQLGILSSSAAEEVPTRNFGFLLTAGTSLPYPSNYFFTAGPYDVLVNYGYSYGLGISYGHFSVYDPAAIDFSIEAVQIQVQTPQEGMGSNSALMKNTCTSILAWTKLFVPAPLSPYVKIGIGGAKVVFDESYSSQFFQSTHFEYWAFSYSVGAGIDFAIATKFKLSFNIESIVAEREHIVSANRNNTGVFVRSQFVPIGLVATIIL
jgi:opacity protein-like surface antigen